MLFNANIFFSFFFQKHKLQQLHRVVLLAQVSAQKKRRQPRFPMCSRRRSPLVLLLLRLHLSSQVGLEYLKLIYVFQQPAATWPHPSCRKLQMVCKKTKFITFCSYGHKLKWFVLHIIFQIQAPLKAMCPKWSLPLLLLLLLFCPSLAALTIARILTPMYLRFPNCSLSYFFSWIRIT